MSPSGHGSPLIALAHRVVPALRPPAMTSANEATSAARSRSGCRTCHPSMRSPDHRCRASGSCASALRSSTATRRAASSSKAKSSTRLRNANLTRERIEKLTAFDFAKLAAQRRGGLETGHRRPQARGVRRSATAATAGSSSAISHGVPDITVFTFSYPFSVATRLARRGISGARKTAARRGATGWSMAPRLRPPRQPCDSAALSRNLVLGEKHGVTGTPSLVFENSERVPGIISNEELEKKFALLARRKG